MIITAVRRVLHAVWAPASMALVVGACMMTLVEHRDDEERRQQLERRADVVEAAIRSIDLDAERAFASVTGTVAATSDPAQLDAAIKALTEAPSLVSTIVIVDRAGAVVATNRDSTLVARAVIDVNVADFSSSRPALVSTAADGGRDRLLFAGASPDHALAIFVELTVDRSAFQDLPNGTAFAATVLDPTLGDTVARTDAPIGQRSVSRRITIGGQPTELVVTGDDAEPGGSWRAAILAALCAAIVTATVQSAVRWRAERKTMHHDERLLDGALTHQQRIEADLRLSETQLRAILDSTPDTVALLEPSQQRFKLLNRPDLLGHDAALFERSGFVFSIVGDDVDQLRTWWTSLSNGLGDAGIGAEFWAAAADGRTCRMHLRAAPLRGTGVSRQHRCLGVFTDITEQHQQREREQTMREELERGRHLESLGRLAGGIAHDFRNVLAAVDMNADLLSTRVSPEGHRYLDVIQRASGRAAEMICQLLSFAKRELGDPVAVDVNQAVLGMESLLRSSVSSTVSIEIALDDLPCVTRAGPGHIDRLVLNLVCNARDAMPLGGKIRIATARGPCAIPPGAPELDWVLVIVADDGVGIADDVIGRVFDPFFTTKGPAGSGLGLASVQGIVSSLGGRVDISSTRGKGTTVTIALPPDDTVTPPAHATRPTEASRREASRREGPRRVILVDDDDQVREPTAAILRDRGFEVIEAATAYEGLAAMAQCPPDVLVTDIVMPGEMNGLDLADLARREFPDVAVVLLSAYADALVADRTQTSHRLICKPIAASELLDAVDDACGVERAAEVG